VIELGNTALASAINGGSVSGGRRMALMTSRLSITTERMGGDMSIKRPERGWNITRAPVHPGEMLREEFMKPLKISMNGLALELHVPVTRISEIVNERRGITADTALRLAR
jgi:addiction module HigA family antidote